MLHIGKTERNYTAAFLIFYVLCAGMSILVQLTDHIAGLSSVMYCFFVIAWGASVFLHIVHKRIRREVIAISAFLFGLFIIRMDVVMGSGMDGIDAARQIKAARPQIKIVLVTSMPEVSFVERARAAGIESFWHKEVQEQPLLEIMDRTMAGESVYPMSTPAVQFGNIISTELTERELDVLRELVSGASNKEIGERLGISASTVKRHISDMLNKTGFKSRLQLAIRAGGGGLAINNRDINTEE